MNPTAVNSVAQERAAENPNPKFSVLHCKWVLSFLVSGVLGLGVFILIFFKESWKDTE